MRGPYRLEVLVEDRSGALITGSLIRQLLARHEAQGGGRWLPVLRPHRGLGAIPRHPESRPEPQLASLLGLLPAKLRAYQRLKGAERPQLLVLVCDSDEKDSRKFFHQLLHFCQKHSGDLPYVIGLAVEELEAWLLGDAAAIQAAYPEADLDQLQTYEQDSVCGTWEQLARVLLGDRAEELIALGYPAVGMYKAEWAQRISPALDLARNQSPSFWRFAKALEEHLGRVEEGDLGHGR